MVREGASGPRDSVLDGWTRRRREEEEACVWLAKET